VGATEVFDALGGGLMGLMGICIAGLFSLLLVSMQARLKDRDARLDELRDDLKERRQEVKDLTAAVNRQTDIIEAWTPAAQRRKVR
jgi:hypothetical protein